MRFLIGALRKFVKVGIFAPQFHLNASIFFFENGDNVFFSNEKSFRGFQLIPDIFVTDRVVVSENSLFVSREYGREEVFFFFSNLFVKICS